MAFPPLVSHPTLNHGPNWRTASILPTSSDLCPPQSLLTPLELLPLRWYRFTVPTNITAIATYSISILLLPVIKTILGGGSRKKGKERSPKQTSVAR